MDTLTLPSFSYSIKRDDEKIWIYDVLRKKHVALTPEEWVRQHFIHFMLDHLHYPKALIKVEGGLKFNRLAKRTDILIFDRAGNPWMLIECKAAQEKIQESTVRQAAVYNAVHKAKYLVLTNGIQTICCQVDWVTGKSHVLESMPVFE